MAAQGRSLLLTQGWLEKRDWWAEKRWTKLQRQLPAWLVERLEIFRRVLVTLTTELTTATTALEAVALARRPKGLAHCH